MLSSYWNLIPLNFGKFCRRGISLIRIVTLRSLRYFTAFSKICSAEHWEKKPFQKNAKLFYWAQAVLIYLIQSRNRKLASKVGMEVLKLYFDPKMAGGHFFSRKIYLLKRGWNSIFLWLLILLVKSCLKISLKLLKSFRRYEERWRIPLSILATYILAMSILAIYIVIHQFLDVLTFACPKEHKETNDIGL